MRPFYYVIRGSYPCTPIVATWSRSEFGHVGFSGAFGGPCPRFEFRIGAKPSPFACTRSGADILPFQKCGRQEACGRPKEIKCVRPNP